MYKCSYYKYIARTVTGIAATLPVFSRQHAAHGHNNILKSTAIITTIATTTAATTAYNFYVYSSLLLHFLPFAATTIHHFILYTTLCYLSQVEYMNCIYR